MNQGQEEQLSRVQRNALVALEDICSEREHAIVTNMVTLYRGGKADLHSLIGGVAAIAELRYLVTKARQDAALAQQSIREMTK